MATNVENAHFAIGRIANGTPNFFKCKGAELSDSLQDGDTLMVYRPTQNKLFQYKFDSTIDPSGIEDSDLLAATLNANGSKTTYSVTGKRFKELFQTTYITLTEPSPVRNEFFDYNQSTITWSNGEKPLVGTSTRTFFYAENSNVKEYLLFDSNTKTLIATTPTPYSISRVNEKGTDTHKYGTYPINVLVRPNTPPKSVGVAHAIGAHQFSDGEWVYILTGNNTWYWSKDMMEWPESQRATQPDGSYRAIDYGFHQYLKNDEVYTCPGDGSSLVLKTSDRGKSWKVAGDVGADIYRGFFYSPSIDTWFIDTGANHCHISTDDCRTFTQINYPVRMTEGRQMGNMWAENPAGLFCFGRKKILKWDNSAKSWSLYKNTSNDTLHSPEYCTFAQTNEDGVILANDLNTSGSDPYARIAADGTVSCHTLGASADRWEYRAMTWRPAQGKSPGLWCMIGDEVVVFSEDGMNWTPSRRIDNRGLGCCADPPSGNILIAGDGSPYCYQLAPDFDPNVQYAGGKLQAELYNGNDLIATSNMVDIP